MRYERYGCDCVGIDHKDRQHNQHLDDVCIHPDGYRHKIIPSREKPT